MPGGKGTKAHADDETFTLRTVVVVVKVPISKKVPRSKEDQAPEAKRDPESIAQAHLVEPIRRVDDLEVTIYSHGCEEKDPSCAVGCQQKEQDATRDVTVEPVFPTPVVICSERQAEEHDGVCNCQVSEVHSVGFPCVHVKDEHPQGDKVPR